MQVQKQDGTLQEFMPEKVVVSIVKTGAPYKDARSIAESLSNRSEDILKSSEIREFVHSQLKSRGHHSAIASWNEFDTEVKQDRMESLAGRSTAARPKHVMHS